MRTFHLMAVVTLLLVTPLARAGEEAPTARAKEAAAAWLALVDAGKYGESWQEAASLFRASVTREQWEGAVQAARGPLGALRSRKLKSATARKSLPGAPDGEYLVIQYQTRFEGKAAAVETVTPMREKNGSWRVSGYYVK
jgi:hypothetical protein